MNQLKRSWRGGISEREIAFEQWLDNLTMTRKLLLFVPTCTVIVYMLVGLLRCLAVVGGQDVSIMHEPWLDWWWTWLFR